MTTFPDDFGLADYFLFDRLREGKGDIRPFGFVKEALH